MDNFVYLYTIVKMSNVFDKKLGTSCLKFFYIPVDENSIATQLTPASRRDPRQHPGPRPPLHLPPLLLHLREVLQASRLDRLPAAAQEERGQDALLQHAGN